MVHFHRISRAIFVLLAAELIPACNGSLGQDQGQGSSAPLFDGVMSATPIAAPGDIVLAWTPAQDISGTGITYDVFYAEGTLPTNSGSETLQFTTTNSTGVTVTGLTSGHSYIFRVLAQDGSGATDGNNAEVGATAP